MKSKVLDNIFISLIESKLHLNLAEGAMYTSHPVSIFPNTVILYDHGIFVTTKKPQSECTGLQYPLEIVEVVWFARTQDSGTFNFMNMFFKGEHL